MNLLRVRDAVKSEEMGFEALGTHSTQCSTLGVIHYRWSTSKVREKA